MIKAEFISPFLEATKQTFAVQCHMKVTEGVPYLKPHDAAHANGSVVSISQFIGNGLHLIVSLVAPEPTYLGIMKLLLGKDYASMAPEIKDGLGEILNIICGRARDILGGEKNHLTQSIPLTFKGQLTGQVRKVSVAIPFESPVGKFQLEMGVVTGAILNTPEKK